MTTSYTCPVCGKGINKNHESYRGRMTREMIRAIREKVPKFHPRDDLCKECGDEYVKRTPDALKPAWMSRPLG